MYLTYDEYQNKGGQLDMTAFGLKENRMQRLLDYWTQGRIEVANENIKDLVFEMVEKEERDIKTFGVDGVSATYEQTSRQELYDLAVAYLPQNLLCVGVELDDTFIR